jgi:hypothetical protein
MTAELVIVVAGGHDTVHSEVEQVVMLFCDDVGPQILSGCRED